MGRNMTANSNKVIYPHTDMLWVSWGKEFVKAIAVTNKLLLQLWLPKVKDTKKQYLKLLSTPALSSSVSQFCFQETQFYMQQ